MDLVVDYIKNVNTYSEELRLKGCESIKLAEYPIIACFYKQSWKRWDGLTETYVKFLLPLKKADGIVFSSTRAYNEFDYNINNIIKDFERGLASELRYAGGIGLMLEEKIINCPENPLDEARYLKKIEFENGSKAYVLDETNDYDCKHFVIDFFPYNSFGFERQVVISKEIENTEHMLKNYLDTLMKDYVRSAVQSYQFAGHLLARGRFIEDW